MRLSLLVPLALLALRLRPESPCGEKEAPMLAALVLFSLVVTLVFSPTSRRTSPLKSQYPEYITLAFPKVVNMRLCMDIGTNGCQNGFL